MSVSLSLTPPSARFGEIETFADRVRQALELSVPVNVEQAVTALGGVIDETPRSDADYEASVERTGDGFTIWLDNVPPNRRTFSIAHELGHLFLHLPADPDARFMRGANLYVDNATYRMGYGREEAEANAFAGALLMPRDEFRTLFRQAGGDEQGLASLARHFGVSRDAAEVRARVLGFRVDRRRKAFSA